jgi:hypothetical protein
MRRASILSLLCVLGVALCALSGCGGAGDNSTPTPKAITSTEINSAGIQLAQSLMASVQSMNATSCSTSTKNQYYCAVPIATTAACTGSGGTSTLTGLVSANWSYYATAPASATLTVMPNQCSIPSSTLAFTGSPSLAVTGEITFFYAAPTAATLNETGTITYGPTPAGSCQVDLAITSIFASMNVAGSCIVTGTVCGQTVAQNC